VGWDCCAKTADKQFRTLSIKLNCLIGYEVAHLTVTFLISRSTFHWECAYTGANSRKVIHVSDFPRDL
jgi:hypothetical protein